MIPRQPRRRAAPRFARSLALAAVAVAPLAPAPASAQLGAIEAFARRVTDLSFNAHVGGLAPGSEEVSAGTFGLRSFGLELLFEVGTVEVDTADAPQQPDSARLTWTEMIVTVGPDGVDTTYTYEVTRPPPPEAPSRTLWTFEMGIGYGQLVGFDAGAPGLEMYGQVRDLPAASLYASYEPLGFYVGARSGFMRTEGLQAFNAGGDSFSGKADSFLLAGMLGHSFDVLGIAVFLETAYSVRYFPSVEWRSQQPGVGLDPVLPRKLSFSSWSVGTGIQFGIGN